MSGTYEPFAPPTEEQIEQLATELREAAKPLIAFRDRYADIECYPEDGSVRMRDVAEDLDRMFDHYDAALRSLEMDAAYDDEEEA